MEHAHEPAVPNSNAKEMGAGKRPCESSATAPPPPPMCAKGVVASLVQTFEVQNHPLMSQSGARRFGSGAEASQERHCRRESDRQEFEDQPLPKRAKLVDVDAVCAEGAAAIDKPPPPDAADGHPPRVLVDDRCLAADAAAVRILSVPAADNSAAVDLPVIDEPAAIGPPVAGSGPRSNASSAPRDATDAPLDELWRKAEMRAVTAEVADGEKRLKALEAERDAREARVARASERCSQAEASVQQATSAVQLAQHAQCSLRAAEWAAAVRVREGVVAADEGRRRLNQLLMLTRLDTSGDGVEIKSTPHSDVLMLTGSELPGERDEKESSAHSLLQRREQQEATCGAQGSEEGREEGRGEGRGEHAVKEGGELKGLPLDAWKSLQMAAERLSAASFAATDHGVDLAGVEEHVLVVNRHWVNYIKLQHALSKWEDTGQF
ncbi:hypothetical protein CLOP_g4140 [Closterium sp. NIES-67]|nr:hypothetical protein CLOP_g4140 [Closterium sp. NIES-67]